MEAAVVNLPEPRDEFIVGVNGYFGPVGRDGRRCGAKVHEIEEGPSNAFDSEQIRGALLLIQMNTLESSLPIRRPRISPGRCILAI